MRMKPLLRVAACPRITPPTHTAHVLCMWGQPVSLCTYRAEPRHAGPHETQCARMRAAATSPTDPPGVCKDEPVHKANNHCPCRSPRSRLGAARPSGQSGPAKRAQRQLEPRRVAANAVLNAHAGHKCWREAGRTNERPRTPSECSAIRPPTSPHQSIQ